MLEGGPRLRPPKLIIILLINGVSGGQSVVTIIAQARASGHWETNKLKMII